MMWNNRSRIGKKIIAWVLALTSTISVMSGAFASQSIETVSAATGTSAAETYYYQTLNRLLGSSREYGITADYLNVTGDVESNFAVNRFASSGTTVGNTVGGKTNVGGNIYVGQSVTGSMSLRSANNIILGCNYTDNKNKTVTFSNGGTIDYSGCATTPNVLVNKTYADITGTILPSIRKTFQSIAAKGETSGVTRDFSDQNNAVLDITACSETICTVNLTLSELDAVQNGGLNIRKNAGQVLILNLVNADGSLVSDTNVSLVREYKVNGVSSTSDNTENADSIYWNLCNMTGTLTLGSICGTVVAPEAGVSDLVGTCRGRLLAASVSSTSSEWHFLDQNLTPEYQGLTDSFYVDKSLGEQISSDDPYSWWIDFTFGGTSTQTTEGNPLDVVFLIDASGSMADNSSRWSSLYSALTDQGGLIDTILSANSRNKIGTVFFENQGSSTSYDFTGSRSTLVSQINANQAVSGQSTYISEGITKADTLLDQADPDAQTMVILLTDGIPGKYSSMVGSADSNHNLGTANNTSYNEAVKANTAMQSLKADHAATSVYTISYAMNSASLPGVAYLGNNYSGSTIYGDDGSQGTCSFTYDGQTVRDSIFGCTAYYSSSDLYSAYTWRYMGNSFWYNDLGKGYYLQDTDFSTAFLKKLATDSSHYYTAETNTIASVLQQVMKSEEVTTKTATNVVIQDQVADQYFKYADALQVQYRTTSSDGVTGLWTDLATTADSTGNYYTITKTKGDAEGGELAFHVSYPAGGTAEVRFNIVANEGVHSSAMATADTPDLPTNDAAVVTYTDVNGNNKSYSSKDPADYGMGTCLDTPYVYIPEKNSINLDKTATENTDGTWTLNLDAYATGTVTTKTNSLPADIVMTLDVTRSMDAFLLEDSSTKKLDALKTSAKQFVETVAADCKNIEGNGTKHRISIVAFDTTITLNQDFLDVSDPANEQTLLNEIDNLQLAGEGGTCTALGTQASLRRLESVKNETGRTRVEMLFTDGATTRILNANGTAGKDPDDSTGKLFSETGANSALADTAAMKSNCGATVYTVAIRGKDQTEIDSSNVTNFLEYMSSDYGTVSSMEEGSKANRVSSDYYLKAASVVQLNDIFSTISNKISSTTVDLDASSVLKDYVTDDFILAGSQGDVTVTTYDYTGLAEDGSRSFSTTGTDITDQVLVSVDGNTVSVSGYDYKSHYVTNNPTAGQKVVVSIKIRRNATTYGGNAVATNGAASGIYNGTDVKATFPVPEVNVPLLYQIGATDTSIYISQDTNASKLGNLDTTVTTDGHVSDLHVLGTPDGVNNKHVTITYTVTDQQGHIVNTYTLPAGTSLTDSPFAAELENLTKDTTYTLGATVAAAEQPVSGFTPATSKTSTADGTVHVFTPTVTCKDTTIFFGEKLGEVARNNIATVSWACSCQETGVAKPETTVPELTYTMQNMADDSAVTADTAQTTPEKDVDVKITAVTAGTMDITSYATVVSAPKEAGVTHVQEDRTFTVHVVKGQLTIQKKIDQQYTSVKATNSEETFVYKIQQYAVQEDGSKGELVATFYQTIGFDANQSTKEQTKTISNLKKGYYTVTEETGWTPLYTLKVQSDNYNGNSSECENLYIGSQENTTVNGKTTYYGLDQKYSALANGSAAATSFTNQKIATRFLSDVASVANAFVK